MHSTFLMPNVKCCKFSAHKNNTKYSHFNIFLVAMSMKHASPTLFHVQLHNEGHVACTKHCMTRFADIFKLLMSQFTTCQLTILSHSIYAYTGVRKAHMYIAICNKQSFSSSIIINIFLTLLTFI